MKSIISLVAVFLLLSGSLKAQKSTIESYTPTTPPVIDGKTDEWEVEWLGDPKGKFAYNLANDDDNLYVRIRMSDPLTQRKVALFGFTVYLNPEGKKGGKLGIKFPIEKDLDELNKRPKSDVAPTPAMQLELKKDLIKDSEALEILGLSKKPIVSTRLGLTNGLQLIIVADSVGDYYYEGKIPFKAMKLEKEKIKTLGVTFQTGRLISKANMNSTAPAGGGFGNSAYNRNMRGYNGVRTFSAQPYNEFNSPTIMSVGVILH
jgi:hypothetical protein